MQCGRHVDRNRTFRRFNNLKRTDCSHFIAILFYEDIAAKQNGVTLRPSETSGFVVCAIVVCTASYLHTPSVTQGLLLFDLLIADSLELVRRINLVVCSVYEQGCFLSSKR